MIFKTFFKQRWGAYLSFIKKKVGEQGDLFKKILVGFYPLSLFLFCFIIWGIPGQGLLYFGDVQASYIFYPEKVYGTLSIWKDLYNAGSVDYGIFQNYLFSLFVILSYWLFGLELHSYFYSLIAFFLFSLSFYSLSRKIFQNDFVAYLIAIFALVSPIVSTYYSGILVIYSFAFINFSMVFLYDIFYGQKKEGVLWKEIIFASIFLTLANVYLQNFFLFLYIFPFFILFHLRCIYQNKAYLLKNFSLVALMYILLNIFWIYLLAFQAFSSSGNFFDAAIQISASMDVANLITKLTNVVNFFRLVPHHFSTGGDTLAQFNSNKILLFTSYLVAFAAFVSIFVYRGRKYRQGILFSLLLFVVTFPVLNGNKPPFENIFLWFWDYVPLAQTFRTFTKLMFINLYAVSYLLGVFLVYLFARKTGWYVKAMAIILLIYPITVYNAPIMRNKFLLQEKIPEYYFEMKESFAEPLNANTMMAPQTNWLVTYKWRTKEKDTDNIFPFFYNGRVFTNGASYTQDQEWQNYNNLTASFIINQYFDKLGYLFSYKNVGFLSLQDDIDSFLDFKDDSRITTESNIKGGGAFFKKVAQYGDIYLYEIPDKYFNHQIFSPRDIYSIKRSSPRQNNLATSSPFIISSLLSNSLQSTDTAFLYEEQNKKLDFPAQEFKKILFDYKGSISLDYASPIDSPKIQAVSKEVSEGKNSKYEIFNIGQIALNKADIEFAKLSSVRYEVNIHNARPGKVPILFSETFNNGWNLYAASRVQQRLGKEQYSCEGKRKKCKSRQASPYELEKYFSMSKISIGGSEYISRDYNGSIQNDNLRKVASLPPLLKKKLPGEHLYANGYSNLFIVDTERLCRENPESCTKNADGTYDVQLTLYFSPQKIFFMMVMGALLVWLTMTGFLFIHWLLPAWRERKVREVSLVE